MEQPTTDKEQPKKGKSLLDKIKEHSDEELHVLATFVRLGVVVWSGFIIIIMAIVSIGNGVINMIIHHCLLI